TNVEQGGAAWRAGLQPGQVLSSVNREPVKNVGEFRQALNKAGNKVLLLVKDGHSSRFIIVTVD
ncbi:MAG: PDZ domain-containing protein, partial [Kiritimatiellales bacterium]|nr:PDZ domain-containing protein [Kiritimatiellales bacterium]